MARKRRRVASQGVDTTAEKILPSPTASPMVDTREVNTPKTTAKATPAKEGKHKEKDKSPKSERKEKDKKKKRKSEGKA